MKKWGNPGLGGEGICPMSHSWWTVELGSDPGWSGASIDTPKPPTTSALRPLVTLLMLFF